MIEVVSMAVVKTRKSTISELTIDGRRQCWVLEDPDRGLRSTMPLDLLKELKIAGDTAIPEGRYRVGLVNSPKFGPRTLHLENVPAFDAIEVHGGNTDKDTRGCQCPGMERDTDKVLGSQEALKYLKNILGAYIDRHEEVWWRIDRLYELLPSPYPSKLVEAFLKPTNTIH